MKKDFLMKCVAALAMLLVPLPLMFVFRGDGFQGLYAVALSDILCRSRHIRRIRLFSDVPQTFTAHSEKIFFL